jgi:uncharacterized protein (TIGR03086 family)
VDSVERNERATTCGELREELLVALAARGVFEREWQMPFGNLPGSLTASIAFMEPRTHGWDVASATGQDAAIPIDLVEAGMGPAIAGGDTLRTPGVCGPAVEVSDDASAQDKFIAFMGRTPEYTSGRPGCGDAFGGRCGATR